MFYSEQLSVQPKDTINFSTEGEVNKEKPIGGIVEASLKLNDLNTVETVSKVITTDNINSNGNKSPSALVPGFLSQAQVKSSSYLPQAESSQSFIMGPININNNDASRINNPY